MASNSRKAVIFDIGRVLVRVDVDRAMKKFAEKIPLTAEEIWPAIEKDPLWHDWQEGRISPHEWHRHLNQKLRGLLTLEEFSEAWNLALDPEPMQNESLFEQLSRRYRLALLSNTDPIHVAHLEATYSFYRYFPPAARIYSCALGASKPSPHIFEAALQSVNARHSEAVFIDDIAAFVEAATQLGLTGIHYRSPAQLVSELTELGLIRSD